MTASNIADAELADRNGKMASDKDVITTRHSSTNDVSQEFIQAIAQHRHWNREQKEQVPA